MLAHRLLTKKFAIGSKKSLKILQKISFNQNCEILNTTRNYSSFRDDTPQPTATSSLVNLRRTLKLSNTEFKDGITNLRTKCPVCDFPSAEDAKDIYINKTTGNNSTHK